jgi:hypothetical protein
MQLLSVFSSIYEWCIGKNDNPIYKEEIFFSVGVFTFLIALIFCSLFYFGLGRWKPVFYRLNHWFITMVVVAITAGWLAVNQSKDATQETNLDAYMIRFSLFNALFAALCFFLLSYFFKKGSIFSKRTPF